MIKAIKTYAHKQKTYKREIAKALLVLWGYIVLKSASTEVGTGDVNQALATLVVITPPIFLYVGAAYTMTWASKQTNLVGEPDK